MGVGYIIGPKIAGVLVAGGVLSWFVFIPLLASLLNDNGGVIAAQLAKLGYLKDISTAGGRVGGIQPPKVLMIGQPPSTGPISGRLVPVLLLLVVL